MRTYGRDEDNSRFSQIALPPPLKLADFVRIFTSTHGSSRWCSYYPEAPGLDLDPEAIYRDHGFSLCC